MGDSGIDENVIIRWIGNIEFEHHTLLFNRTDIMETECGVWTRFVWLGIRTCKERFHKGRTVGSLLLKGALPWGLLTYTVRNFVLSTAVNRK